MWGSTIGCIVVLTLGLLAVPHAAEAQSPATVARVGWLSDGIRVSAGSHLYEAFLQGLRDLDYVEGQNLVMERRDAEGHLDRLPELAAQLVARQVEVIVTWGVPGTRAAQQATRTIPIVMAEAGDPVGTGLVASLAQPGGNVTGLSVMAPDITGKQLQLLKEAAPTISRVAVL